MATERMKRAAELIAGGTGVAEAMAEVGYGPGCIDGLAGQFPAVLADAGLTGPRGRGRGRAAADDGTSTKRGNGDKTGEGGDVPPLVTPRA